MAVTTKRVGLVRRAWKHPDSPDGRGLTVSLLGADERAPVRYLLSEMRASETRRAHAHSEDLVACVTQGRVTFWFGEDFAERVDVAPGDYILVPRMLAHREAADAQGAEMIVAHLAPFETVEVEERLDGGRFA